MSLPGSVSGPQDEDQLFTKEDINAIANTQKINGVKGSYGKHKAPGTAGLGPYSFRSSVSGFAFRGKSFKGSSHWQSGAGRWNANSNSSFGRSYNSYALYGRGRVKGHGVPHPTGSQSGLHSVFPQGAGKVGLVAEECHPQIGRAHV